MGANYALEPWAFHHATLWETGTPLGNRYISSTGPVTVSIGGGLASLYTIVLPANALANTAIGSGSYLVIGRASIGAPTPVFVFPGSPTDPLSPGSTTQKYLQVIKNGAGKLVPATTTAVPGSLLLIAEPAYFEFTSDTELVPVVYESVEGVWRSVVQADPPEGFVATPGALQASVTDKTLQAVQFSIKDVGSTWTETTLTHKLKHNGRDITVVSKPKMINKQKK